MIGKSYLNILLWSIECQGQMNCPVEVHTCKEGLHMFKYNKYP